MRAAKRTRPFVIATLVVVALVVTACGSEGGGGVGGSGPSPGTPDDTVSSTPDPNASPTGGGAQLVEPQPGQVDLRAIPWMRAKVLDDGMAVKVFWWSGVEPCNVLDHVTVEYSDQAVAITLFEGHTETDEDVACIEIALKKATIVELDELLGTRKVVDGAP